jgi:hypothetical protein
MSSPWKWMLPAVTSYSGEPSSALASVLLPLPLGPMMRVHLAGADGERQALQDLGRRTLGHLGRPRVQVVDTEQGGRSGVGHAASVFPLWR